MRLAAQLLSGLTIALVNYGRMRLMAKFGASDDNALVWVPDAEQSAVLDWLAMGYA